MNSEKAPKGPWIHRFAIRLFTAVFSLLLFWLLGFLVEDIEAIQGPQYREFEKNYLDAGILDRQRNLLAEINALQRDVVAKREAMALISDSSQSLQTTTNQLIDLQKLALQKSLPTAAAEQSNFSDSIAMFLQRQRQYQGMSSELAGLLQRKQDAERAAQELENAIEAQRKPARLAFRAVSERHRMRLAGLQLLMLIPIFALAAWLLIKRRDSIYLPLYIGFGAASLIKVSLVIHQYFPSRYFKYVLVMGLLLAVVKLLLHFIRSVAQPKTQWLLKQYREAYERFLCPVCEYPMRVGPRKYLYWTRRTVNKLVLPQQQVDEEPYSCPACGTGLLEACGECGKMRHSLLPYCQHCNAEKSLPLSG